MEKKILDVTCGARSIWFNKHHPAAVYCDKRREQYHHLWKNAGNCTLDINPDVVCDFTDLPFPDNSFPLVVFDPPHLTGAKETAWLVKKYGKLDENWPKMLHDGFRECMRVLKPDGVLIFKWSEYDIPAAEVWKAIGQKPLFGHHSGKRSRTFWACFMKLEEMASLAETVPPNEPLTLEQLREMKNKPAYLNVFDPLLESGWHIIKAVTEDKIIFRGWQTVYVPIDGMGIDYNLYRRPPEGEANA